MRAAISRRRAASRPITSRNGTGAVGRPRFGDVVTRAVYALAVSGSTLYAGGNFTTAGGSAANHIAQWNGSSWSALGSGIEQHRVYALAVSGSTLYAGGDFTTAGGIAANYIAQWNGSSWSALGSGIQVNDGTSVSCAGGVGQHIVCGRRFHDGGRQRGQSHRAMEREQLVGPRFGDERLCVCAGGVGQHVVCGRRISRRRAAARPMTSRNGTGAVGRPWVRG